MISCAKAYENDKRIAGMSLSDEGLNWDGYYEGARDYITSLNRLSANLFAASSVAERQIAILRDLHTVFLTSYRTKTSHYENGCPLRRNLFHKNIIPIPILSESPKQLWQNTLETIDELVRERECFISKITRLVENMEIRRKIV